MGVQKPVTTHNSQTDPDKLMSITQPGSTPSPHTANWQTLLSRPQLAQEVSNWKVGDTQSARVQAVLPDNQNNGPAGTTRVLLNIGGRLVTANLPLVVKVGDQLEMTLRTNQELLLRLANGQSSILSLKTLASASASAPSLSSLLQAARSGQTSRTSPLDAALGRVLPFQGRLLETLGTLLQLPASRLNPDLASVLALLRGMIPSGQNLATPETLKQAMQQSGAFAEKQLLEDPQLAARLFDRAHAAASDSRLPRDFKLLLLRLFVLLGQNSNATPTPAPRPLAPLWQPAGNPVAQPLQFPHPEFLRHQGRGQTAAQELSRTGLLKLIAQGLSRIQATQLNSVLSTQTSAEPVPANTWLFELPAWSGQQLALFQVRLEEYRQSQSNSKDEERSAESVWRITLSFNLEPLGPLYSLVRIQKGKVSSSFWTEREDTLNLLERELPQLHRALSKLGLEVESLEAMRGTPSFTQTRLETQLVDIRT